MSALGFPDPKPIVKSKTFYANILMATVAPFMPPEFAAYVPYIMAGVNVLLRLISKGKVELL